MFATWWRVRDLIINPANVVTVKKLEGGGNPTIRIYLNAQRPEGGSKTVLVTGAEATRIWHQCHVLIRGETSERPGYHYPGGAWEDGDAAEAA